jgi:hypothetical protein
MRSLRGFGNEEWDCDVGLRQSTDAGEKSLVEEDPGIRLTRLPCFERTDRLMVGLRRIVNADS